MRQKDRHKSTGEKVAHNMVMKLTSGVNSSTFYEQLFCAQILKALLGSARLRAARRTLMKLTSGGNKYKK